MLSSRLLLTCSLALGCVSASAHATDYIMTVSGPYQSFSNDGTWFDGTDFTPLDPLFNISRLAGGTFRATYRFSDVPPSSTSDTIAFYDFASGSGMTYELFDSSGAVVHGGTNPSASGATVLDNFAGFGGTSTDAVSFYGFVNSVTNLITPAPRYSPPGEVGAIQSTIGFDGLVTGGVDYLTSIALPTVTSVYQSFPNAGFRAGMYFGDGDFLDQNDPFQYIETSVSYTITSVSVTAVPAPGAAGVLVFSGLIAAARRRR